MRIKDAEKKSRRMNNEKGNRCKGLACPRPVILTKKELDVISAGEVKTLVDNQVAVETFQGWRQALS
ncbi:sulfurtransferase TusA family protein [Gudongella oleilytica]|uniref:sulfurtransferase TusA family protein n=1 Tax=Gudongella oleilytica TaxID=1582259 RepID=UPI0019D19EEE|nr:sulfurtransferase TusA family protein [Gudongella oleilytica]